ncbi:MAG: alternative ribosome rescue aminoacyl-tRNA hydrolase ArfB [Candidatus Anammoxibacter sp.]
MLQISNQVTISEVEIEIHAIRSQGPGGQNVNKVATAIQLRFDIKNSSLPDFHKRKLLARNDYRITKDGVIVIKAQRYRSQDKNRGDALYRLQELIKTATIVRKKRVVTKPTKASKRRRLDSKKKRGQLKTSRGKINSSVEH